MDAVCKQLGETRAVHDRGPSRCPAPRRQHYSIGERLRAARRSTADEQLDLRVRAGAAPPPRGGHPPARDHQPRRHPPQLRLGMGPCQGGFCIYRATGILHGMGGIDAAQANGVAAALPAGALEGRLADPLRRPAAPGAAGRVDLPGRARRGAPARRHPRSASCHYDAVVIGAGMAGLTAAMRLAEAGARVLRAGQGRGLDASGAGHDRRAGLRAERVEAPARGAARRSSPRVPTIPTRSVGVESVAPALRVVRRAHRRRPRPAIATSATSSTTTCCPAPSACCARPRSCPRRWPTGTCAAGEPVCVVGAPRAARLPRGAVRGQPRGAPGSRRARSRSTSSSTARTPTRSGSRARFDDPTSAPRSPGSWLPQLHGDERVGLPAVLGLRDPHGAWADLQRAPRAGGVFEIPTLPPSVPGHARLRGPARGAARAPAGASCWAPRWSAPSARAGASPR